MIVLVASGAYLLIYLYRWEWNRALISGVFFIAAEVALATASLGRRMSRIEERVDRLDRPVAGSAPRAAVDPSVSSIALVADQPEEAEPSDGPFPWLEPGSMSVFVPVLLGIGAILSGVAYVIERVATSTDPDARPDGGRAPPGRTPVTDELDRSSRTDVAGRPWSGDRGSGWSSRSWSRRCSSGRWSSRSSSVTQNRPDPIGTGGRTSFAMVIDVRGDLPADVLPIAQALVTSCRPMASPWSTIELHPLAGSTVRLDVTPSLAENAGRRFTGCLTDLQLDRVLVHLRRAAGT